MALIQWGSAMPCRARALFVRSVIVSVAAQKMGSKLVHPIGRASRNVTSGLSKASIGKATPRSGMCHGARWMQ